MDPVSRLGRALAIIRRAAGRQPTTTGLPGQPKDDPAAQQATEAEFRAVVAQRLSAVSRQDPNRRHASTRVFLEQVLMREFGKEVLNSHRFQDTVREVQRVMEADAAVRAELDSLVEDLIAGKAGD